MTPYFQFALPKVPVKLLPGWLYETPRLIRSLPDGQLDEQFNAQAARATREINRGEYRLSAVDAKGRAIVGLQFGLVLLGAKGQILPPGPVALKRIRTKDRAFRGLTGLAFGPDGSILATSE